MRIPFRFGWGAAAVSLLVAGGCSVRPAIYQPSSSGPQPSSELGPLFAAPVNQDGKPDRSAQYAEELVADYAVLTWGIEGGVAGDAPKAHRSAARNETKLQPEKEFASNSFSVEFWAQAPRGNIVRAGDELSIGHDDALSLTIGGQQIDTKLRLEAWSHVGIVVSERDVEIAVNGLRKASFPLQKRASLSSSSSFVVGGLSSGALDELAFFDRRLPLDHFRARTLLAEGARTPRPRAEALPLELVPQGGHAGAVFSVAASADGRFFATGGAEGMVYLWDAHTGELLRGFPTSEPRVVVQGVAFDPAGRFIAAGGSSAHVWDLETGRLVRRFGNAGLQGAQFSPDGRYLATMTLDNAVVVYELASGRRVKRFEGHTAFVMDVEFLPDGKHLASTGQDSKLFIWSLENDDKREVAFNGLGADIAAHPNGSVLAVSVVGGDHAATLYDPLGNVVGKVDPGAMNGGGKLAFARDGSELFATTSLNGIRAYSTKNWAQIREIGKGHTPQSVAVGPDKRRLVFGSVYGDGVLSPDGDLELPLSTGESALTNVQFTPNGTGLWMMAGERGAGLFDLGSLRQVASVTGNVQAVTPSGGKVITVEHGVWSVGGWDPKAPRTTLTVDPSRQSFSSADMGRRASEQNAAAVATETELLLFQKGAGVEGGSAERYSLKSGSKLGSIQLPGVLSQDLGGPTRVVASGRAVMGGCVLQLSSGERLKCIEMGKVSTVALSPDGKRIATSFLEPGLTLIDLDSDREVWNKGQPTVDVGIAFSPDGAKIASYSLGRKIRFYDAATGAEEGSVQSQLGGLAQLSYHPNGKLLALGGQDGVVEVWDLQKRRAIRVARAGSEWIAFDEQGNFNGSRDAHLVVRAVRGTQAFNIDQLALLRNRPDLLLQGFPLANPEATAFYRARVEQRFKKHGLSMTAAPSNAKPPVARIVSAVGDGKQQRLVAELSSDGELSSYQIYVNGVPLGPTSFPVQGRRARVEQSIVLSPGPNRIELAATDAKGLESLRVVSEAQGADGQGQLYFVGFGVSHYKDSRLDLGYAHKDALDLATALAALPGYSKVNTKTFVDAEVTNEAIDVALEWTRTMRPEDTFVLFAAGHGVHDKSAAGEYYFISHAVELARLSETAIPFDRLEQLLSASRARRKLFLLDTCESGEEEVGTGRAASASANNGPTARGFRGLVYEPESKAAAKPWVTDRNNFVFRNLQRRSGAIVFASSRANEKSYEDPGIENGYFTEGILSALAKRQADSDRSGDLSLPELERAVTEAVSERSAGRQNPVIDRENIHQRFALTVTGKREQSRTAARELLAGAWVIDVEESVRKSGKQGLSAEAVRQKIAATDHLLLAPDRVLAGRPAGEIGILEEDGNRITIGVNARQSYELAIVFDDADHMCLKTQLLPVTECYERSLRIGLGGEPARTGSGVALSVVATDFPAARAGMRVGDVLLEVDGKPISRIEDVAAQLLHKQRGDSVSATIERDGVQTRLTMTLLPADALARPSPDAKRRQVPRSGRSIAELMAELEKLALRRISREKQRPDGVVNTSAELKVTPDAAKCTMRQVWTSQVDGTRIVSWEELDLAAVDPSTVDVKVVSEPDKSTFVSADPPELLSVAGAPYALGTWPTQGNRAGMRYRAPSGTLYIAPDADRAAAKTLLSELAALCGERR